MRWTTDDMIDHKIWWMHKYYSIEEESKYGILEIHIKLIENDEK